MNKLLNFTEIKYCDQIILIGYWWLRESEPVRFGEMIIFVSSPDAMLKSHHARMRSGLFMHVNEQNK